MNHPEVPDEDLPHDVDQVLMPSSVRDGLLASLRRVDQAIANALTASDELPTANDLELMTKIGDWTEHSRRVQNVLHHIITDEERIAHLDFAPEQPPTAEE